MFQIDRRIHRRVQLKIVLQLKLLRFYMHFSMRCSGKFHGRSSMTKKHILMGALVLLLPVTLLAQTNATVGGTVGDAAGAVSPGVGGTARDVNTGIGAHQM